MSEENKAKVRRMVEGFFSPNADAIIDELVAPDIVDHNPVPDQKPGVEGLRELIGVLHDAFPDGRFTLGGLIAEGDRVAARWTFQGTHRGEFIGIAATGKQVSMAGITIDRFAGGKVVEH